jgi:bacillithiol biosynthesis cysteine-adding enzyme BshC
MKFNATQLPYHSTGLFSKLVNDYIEAKPSALAFANYAPNLEGVAKAIEQRAKFPVDRNVLVSVLKEQYLNVTPNKAVHTNVELLLQENTFVVTTAHQPNIFTGPLYFFYKIIHAIELAADLKKQFPHNNFVPVYYMGSEDADIDEVGSFYLDGTKHQWITKQTGAIGRMKVDDALLGLIKNIEGFWSVKKQGGEALESLKNAYTKGATINQATLSLVNDYFGKYGLVVLQPDEVKLKTQFIPVMEKELLSQFSQKALQPTIADLAASYHVQTEGRSLNLFYLKDNLRARIELDNSIYKIVDTDLEFTQAEIIAELHAHPDRFSPNVILRGVYQETILPGVVFIGGGGELAYWLELKNVFKEAGVHYPVLQLRNSFLFVKQKLWEQWTALGFNYADLFKPLLELDVKLVKSHAQENLSLAHFQEKLTALYKDIQTEVIKVDPTLGEHTFNLSVQSHKKLAELEKKMLKAEKRKQATNIERVHKIKKELFIHDSLQERVDNFAQWVGEFGWAWVDAILTNSNTMEQGFTIITIEKQ